MIYGLQIAGRRDLLDAQFPHDNHEGFLFNTLFFPSYFVSLYTLFTIGNLLMEVWRSYRHDVWESYEGESSSQIYIAYWHWARGCDVELIPVGAYWIERMEIGWGEPKKKKKSFSNKTFRSTRKLLTEKERKQRKSTIQKKKKKKDGWGADITPTTTSFSMDRSQMKNVAFAVPLVRYSIELIDECRSVHRERSWFGL